MTKVGKRGAGNVRHRAHVPSLTAKQRVLFQQALALHQQGHVARAHILYEQVLAVQPLHFDSLHLLGVIAVQSGDARRGVDLISQALQIDPQSAVGHNNLAAALEALQRFEEAVASCDRALALQPGYAEAYNNRGSALRSLGRLDAAIASFDSAIAHRPAYAEAFNNRGSALSDAGRNEEALASYDRAIALRPAYAEAHHNRGLALRTLNRLEDAVASYDRAIALRPGYAEAYSNRGAALRRLKQFETALDSFERALAVTPDHAEANLNKGLALLQLADFAQGWEFYEWRFRSRRKHDLHRRMEAFRQPMLEPHALQAGAAGRLLIWAEQGVGDEVMFGSMLPEARQVVNSLQVQLDKRLLPLFRRSMPDIVFRASDEPVSEADYDAHLPIGNLGSCFRRSAADFARARHPFLKADAERRRELRNELCEEGELLVGISWRSKNEEQGPDKSMTLEKLATALAGEGVRLVSLQYGDVDEEIQALREKTGLEVLQANSVDTYNDLDGLAALIDACDLIVSISNVTVHLAGALGKPVWILLQHVPDWRWLLDRTDSPWYPSARLYGQQVKGDWAAPLDSVAGDFRRFRQAS